MDIDLTTATKEQMIAKAEQLHRETNQDRTRLSRYAGMNKAELIREISILHAIKTGTVQAPGATPAPQSNNPGNDAMVQAMAMTEAVTTAMDQAVAAMNPHHQATDQAANPNSTPRDPNPNAPEYNLSAENRRQNWLSGIMSQWKYIVINSAGGSK